ncbi:hypothetical protein ScPMuIL_006489 [Solemya velum]
MPSTLCSVPLCAERGGHAFPRNEKWKKQWIDAIKRDKWKPTAHSIVCQKHFKESDYLVETHRGTSTLHHRLRKGVIPSIFAWTKSPTLSAVRRESRLTCRKKLIENIEFKEKLALYE